jgi:tetratricopeptide (TPR) repeat protein
MRDTREESRKPGAKLYSSQKWLWSIPVLLALLVNLNVLKNGYGWDDEDIISNLRPPERWGALFLPDPNAGPFSMEASAYYRPMVSVSYLLDNLLWRDQPFGFHLSVWLVHLLNTALVFFLARSLTHGIGSSQERIPTNTSRFTLHGFLPLVSASLFAVHPAHAEAVAWIPGRSDVFCSAFMLSSLVLYIRFHRTESRTIFSLSVLFFFLALLTKEIAVGLIVLFPLYEYLATPHEISTAWRQMAVRWIGPCLVFGLYFWMRTANNISSYGSISAAQGFGWDSAWKIISAYGLYLKLMIFPYPHFPFIDRLPNSFVFLIASGLSLAGVGGGMLFALIRRHRVVGMGLGWMLVLLTPAVVVAIKPLAATRAAERYVYAPTAGFLIVLVWLSLKGIEKFRAATGQPQRRIWLAAGIMILIAVATAWGWESWKRNAVWRSPLTFWQAASDTALEAGLPFSELGLQYARMGRQAEAETVFQKAIIVQEKALGPVHPDLAKSLNNLAELYRTQNRQAEAEPIHKRILAIRERTLGPNHPYVARSLNNLALIYHTQGREAEAEALYRRAISIWEKSSGSDLADLAKSLNNLATLYGSQDRFTEAEPLFRRSITIWEKALGPDHPNLITSLENYAALLRKMHREKEAAAIEARAQTIRNKSVVGN